MSALNENAITLLSTTTVSLGADADTTLYTVPVGKTCILSHALLEVGADAVSTDISIGQAAAGTDFIPTTQLDNANADGDVVPLYPIAHLTPPTLKAYAAGTVIEAKVSNQAGGASNELHLFGFVY